MAFGFFRQPRLVVYGDGDGNVVIEEFMDDDCQVMTARISIEWDRFESFQNFWDTLRDEAFNGVKERANEA